MKCRKFMKGFKSGFSSGFLGGLEGAAIVGAIWMLAKLFELVQGP